MNLSFEAQLEIFKSLLSLLVGVVTGLIVSAQERKKREKDTTVVIAQLMQLVQTQQQTLIELKARHQEGVEIHKPRIYIPESLDEILKLISVEALMPTSPKIIIDRDQLEPMRPNILERIIRKYAPYLFGICVFIITWLLISTISG